MDENTTGIVGILGIALCVGILAAAKVFFPSLFTVLVWVLGIIVLLMIILGAVVIWFAFKKPKAGPEAEKAAKRNEIISEAKNKVMSVRRTCMAIKNVEIRNSGIKVCMKADKIIGVVRQKTSLVSDNRQFFSYYLPMFGSIVEKYEKVEKSSVADAEMTEKVLEHLKNLEIAFEKQYKSLYAGDMLDLSVEMEAMSIVCKRDGLLSDVDFELKEEKTEENEA